MAEKRGNDSNFFNQNKVLIAITTLMGTIIGAGILGIPYVVSQAGFLYGLFLLILLGAAFMFVNLFIGEIVLRTKGQYQLPGYAEKYLGRSGKVLMTFSMIVAIYGALTAYIIGEGTTLRKIIGSPAILLKIFSFFPPALSLFMQDNFYYLLFFVIGAVIISKGIKATGKMELILVLLLILIVIFIGILSYSQIKTENLRGFNLAHLFLPYGVILFSYMASPAVPELQEVLGRERQKMKKAIIIGSFIPIIMYIAFTMIVVGIVGTENFSMLGANERIATIALSVYTWPLLSLFANIMAILSMFTSFLTLGTALTELYYYDYKLSKVMSFVLTFFIPLLLVLLNLTSFIVVIGITGALAGGLEGVLIVLMFWKAKFLGNRKPEYSLGPSRIIGILLIFMFLIGIIYEIWHNFF